MPDIDWSALWSTRDYNQRLMRKLGQVFPDCVLCKMADLHDIYFLLLIIHLFYHFKLKKFNPNYYF